MKRQKQDKVTVFYFANNFFTFFLQKNSVLTSIWSSWVYKALLFAIVLHIYILSFYQFNTMELATCNVRM